MWQFVFLFALYLFSPAHSFLLQKFPIDHKSFRVRIGHLNAKKIVRLGVQSGRALGKKGLLKKTTSPGVEDNEVEEVKEYSIESLKETWRKSGRSEASFSKSDALMLAAMSDDEDDEEDTTDESESGFISFDRFAETFPLPKKASNPVATPTEKLSENRERSVGIDLGTTYSAVSVIEGGKAVIIPLQEGNRILPSIVAYLPNNDILVGESARRQIVMNPENTFVSVKRVIGRSSGDLKGLKSGASLPASKLRSTLAGDDMNKRTQGGKVLPFDGGLGGIGSSPLASPSSKKKLKNSSSNPIALECPRLKDKKVLPEEISAEVIKELLKHAANHLKGDRTTKAVITVPAYFSPAQCEATERAGKLAGLEKVKLLREPEAAALAYGFTSLQKQIVLVFDLGGGTFDVSVLEVGDGFVEVIATSGDSYLGGDDFDEVIKEWLLDQFAIKCPESVKFIKNDPVAQSRLLEEAEKAKRRLSSERVVQIDIPFLYGTEGLTVELTRAKFESLSKNLYNRLLRPLREVSIMAGINLPGESGLLGFTEDYDDENGDNDAYPAPLRHDLPVNSMSINTLKKEQVTGKRESKDRKKARGTTVKELKRLQRTLGDPSISAFPGGRALDDIILVGGATHMSGISRLIQRTTGIVPRRTVNPDEAVSLGAAVMAGILDGDITNMQVMSAWQSAMYRMLYEVQLQQKQKQGGLGLGQELALGLGLGQDQGQVSTAKRNSDVMMGKSFDESDDDDFGIAMGKAVKKSIGKEGNGEGKGKGKKQDNDNASAYDDDDNDSDDEEEEEKEEEDDENDNKINIRNVGLQKKVSVFKALNSKKKGL